MWTPFSKEQPKEQEYVTIIWDNGGESDCIWTEIGMIWDDPEYPIPVFWKICPTIQD